MGGRALGADGSVTVVDWPWACRGPVWLDTLFLLVDVRLYGDRQTDALLASHAYPRGASPAEVTSALAGLAGFFTDGARRPDPPGLPTPRAFQHARAEAIRSWLRERLDQPA